MRFSLTKAFLAVLAFAASSVKADKAKKTAFELFEEDGTSLGMVTVHGGNFNHWIEDARGYSICSKDNVGVRERHLKMLSPQTLRSAPSSWNWYYCDWEDRATKVNVIASQYAVANTDPYTTDLDKHIHKTIENIMAGTRRRRLEEELIPPTTGTVKNLVILMRFSDHANKDLPSQEDINDLLNSDSPISGICPTGSMKGFYRDNSGGKVNIESFVTPWITLDAKYTQEYCADNDAGGSGWPNDVPAQGSMVLPNECIANLLSKADQYITKDFDLTGTGFVDAITFFQSGYCASNTGSADRIWSHQGWLENIYTASSGVKVEKYNINSAWAGGSGNKITTIGTPVHEFGHVFGLPDFYDRNDGGDGLGLYSVMSNDSGVDGTGEYPPQMDPWAKIKLGWGNVETLTTSENGIVLEPSYTSHNYYKIDHCFPSGEYLLIENRQKVKSDVQFDQAGILIYHIDEKKSKELNSDGDGVWNDQEGHPGNGFPSNGKHYHNALIQADGDFDLERLTNGHDAEDFFFDGGVTEVKPGSQYPNTNSYQDGNVKETGVTIKNIRSAGGLNMQFDLILEGSCASTGTNNDNSGTNNDNSGCDDYEGFADSDGWTCSDYDADSCAEDGDQFANADGDTANDACCVCGGGDN